MIYTPNAVLIVPNVTAQLAASAAKGKAAGQMNESKNEAAATNPAQRREGANDVVDAVEDGQQAVERRDGIAAGDAFPEHLGAVDHVADGRLRGAFEPRLGIVENARGLDKALQIRNPRRGHVDGGVDGDVLQAGLKSGQGAAREGVGDERIAVDLDALGGRATLEVLVTRRVRRPTWTGRRL